MDVFDGSALADVDGVTVVLGEISRDLAHALLLDAGRLLLLRAEVPAVGVERDGQQRTQQARTQPPLLIEANGLAPHM